MNDLQIVDEQEDVEAACIDPGILLPKTKELYDVFIKKLWGFLNFEGDIEKLPKELLSDGSLANFLLKLDAIHDYKPHFKKTALAAISYLLRIHCMESLLNSSICIRIYIMLFRYLLDCFVLFDVLSLFVCRSGELN
jgi:hypothetical protein